MPSRHRYPVRPAVLARGQKRAAAGQRAADPGYRLGMGSQPPDVLVIGAGVSGLTTAVCLAEAGLTVAVEAAEPPQHTTSSAAGAIWGPHLVGADARVAGWAEVTLARLRQMAGDHAAGIREIGGIASEPPRSAEPTKRPGPPGPPGWTDGVGDRVRCEDSELPAGFTSGWRFSAPVISMPAYLGYLEARFADAGGSVRYGRAFASLAAAAGQVSADVIVNCCGIGAYDLVPDPELVPVRGQAVVVANPGIGQFFVGVGPEPGDLTYLFPHAGTVVLGGTQQPGSWDRQPDPATAARILRACAAVEPRLRGSSVLAHKVGLRPVRPRVRLEAERTADGRLILHNYGHGGAGVTLSWGCALEVTRAVCGR
jgi:D-amino-acid oxidase